ncbi:unnamed protein product, partial [Ectocarpus sp. 6 AP-2014]
DAKTTGVTPRPQKSYAYFGGSVEFCRHRHRTWRRIVRLDSRQHWVTYAWPTAVFSFRLRWNRGSSLASYFFPSPLGLAPPGVCHRDWVF